jgi:hypothetical protein
MPVGFWITMVFMIGGMLTWSIAAEIAKGWLVKNDPHYEPPGIMARMFIGRLFTAFGPVSRYATLRREQGLPTTASTVFYVGLVTSFGGLIAFFISLGTL